ncbi:MAG TPA: acetamidase/formamidase family protein, partial [Actinomycetes bacterium]|nr:acetamidase/formamidase family protein [Actinomycetes bacterium]
MSTVHRLTAATVHSSWSGAHAPVLTVRSGDEVAFECRDGFDGQLRGRASGPLGDNDLAGLDFGRIAPLTGPIRVEGARPGDGLSVQILDLAPSGPGWTVVWPQWCGFDYHRPATVPPSGHLRVFDAETLRGGGSVELGPARVPVAPMLGMIGLAPAKGRFPTQPPREFGGNLDLRLVGPGAIVRLPVLVDGANLSVGDGHAAQGDGEVCTTAIECAMTGRLRVWVEPGAAPTQPEVETPEAYITTGYGRTLDDAVRMAIDGMHGWLCRRGLNPVDAYMLLSIA